MCKFRFVAWVGSHQGIEPIMDSSDTSPNLTHDTINIQTVKSGISLWLERWFLSSNAKDIGVLYLIFALVSGLIGTAFSVLIRLELSGPSVQFIADNQLYCVQLKSYIYIYIGSLWFEHNYSSTQMRRLTNLALTRLTV